MRNAKTFDGVVHEVRFDGDSPMVPCQTAALGNPDSSDWHKVSVFLTDEPITCLECLSNVPQRRST